VALRPTDCEVAAHDRIAIMGPSGSGKSTLIHLLAGLDKPTAGSVAWPALGESGLLRPGTVAVVFQGPSLLPELTVEENTALPLVLAGSTDRAAHEQARIELARVGLADIADKLPEEISGGQSQRAAVARCLAGRPRLLLADEPTGQLDHEAGAAMIEVLVRAADESGAGLVVSSHDPSVAECLTTRWTMADGRLETSSLMPA
jgi:ABC-type lipoprotein export system ATPase subunit